MRCRICPAVADEEHCEKCHAVYEELQTQDAINTEAINQ